MFSHVSLGAPTPLPHTHIDVARHPRGYVSRKQMEMGAALPARSGREMGDVAPPAAVSGRKKNGRLQDGPRHGLRVPSTAHGDGIRAAVGPSWARAQPPHRAFTGCGGQAAGPAPHAQHNPHPVTTEGLPAPHVDGLAARPSTRSCLRFPAVPTPRAWMGVALSVNSGRALTAGRTSRPARAVHSTWRSRDHGRGGDEEVARV
jgi:hypothetical protein